MSKFTKLKTVDGDRIQIDLAKVEYVRETDDGTQLSLNSGEELLVEESFQTVSNRLKVAFGDE